MGYHIFVVKQDNFEACIERGVYGGAAVDREATNAEIIASFSAIRVGDFVFFYVTKQGVYGLWEVTQGPFYDEQPLFEASEQLFPYRVCFKPTVRKFSKGISLVDILDLRDKGRIWTFDLGAITKKNHYPVTSQEGEQIIRLLLRNNPLHSSAGRIARPYSPLQTKSLPLTLECRNSGQLRFEGLLNAWFTRSFAQGRLRELIGDYRDVLNYVPTSFNTVMDLFLTHVTTLDSVDILHKFTCMELKTGKVKERDLHQIVKYENWLVRKLADGDSEMVQSILVGFDFDEKVVEYREKRKKIEEKMVRLIRYRVKEDKSDIVLTEV